MPMGSPLQGEYPIFNLPEGVALGWVWRRPSGAPIHGPDAVPVSGIPRPSTKGDSIPCPDSHGAEGSSPPENRLAAATEGAFVPALGMLLPASLRDGTDLTPAKDPSLDASVPL